MQAAAGSQGIDRNKLRNVTTAVVAVIIIAQLLMLARAVGTDGGSASGAWFRSHNRPGQWMEIVTVTGCKRRPDSVIGDLAVWCNDPGTEREILLQGEKIPRVLTHATGKMKGPMQEKSDMSQILRYFQKKYESVPLEQQPIGVLIKEDDFTLCVTTDFILQALIDLNIHDGMVNLSYGSGLFYVSLAYIDEYVRVETACQVTIDSCFSQLKNAHRTDLPLAVHRSDNSNNQQHRHHCDTRCFVPCKDAGMTMSHKEAPLLERVTSRLLNGKTYGPTKKVYSCNSSDRSGYPYEADVWAELCVNEFKPPP